MVLQQEDWRQREKLGQFERIISEVERFNAMKFFTVDRAALLGVLSTVATYLIILMQEKKPWNGIFSNVYGSCVKLICTYKFVSLCKEILILSRNIFSQKSSAITRELETERIVIQAGKDDLRGWEVQCHEVLYITAECAALLGVMSKLRALLLPNLPFLCKINNCELEYPFSELGTPQYFYSKESRGWGCQQECLPISHSTKSITWGEGGRVQPMPTETSFLELQIVNQYQCIMLKDHILNWDPLFLLSVDALIWI